MRDDLAWYGWFLSFAAVGLFVAWLVPGSQWWWIVPIFIGVGSAIASRRVPPLAPEGELPEVKPSPDPEYAERLKGTFIR